MSEVTDADVARLVRAIRNRVLRFLCVFFVDVLLCDACGGPRRLLAFITDVGSIRRILTHLGFPDLPPPSAPARPPPMRPLPFA